MPPDSQAELYSPIGLDRVLASARGRKALPLEISYKRDLTEADLSLLLAPGPQGSTTPAVKSLKDTHHALARALADGLPPAQCSLITGYSISRISILRNHDPLFKELLTYYEKNREACYVDVHQRLAGLGLNAIGEIQERLEVEPEKFSTAQLLAVAEFTLDRSVTADQRKGGPGSGGGGAPVTVQVNFIPSAEAKPSFDGQLTTPQRVIDLEPLDE